MEKKSKSRAHPGLNIPKDNESESEIPLSERKVLSISQVTRLIKDEIESKFDDLWVEGEISNFKVAGAAGHAFFRLKDAGAVLNALIFAGSLRQMKVQFKDGLKILAHGRVSVYEPSGEYRLLIDRVEISGMGALQQAFEELKRKLQAEGYFDPAHKRPLPLLPLRIGVATSKTGAALQDILKILFRRFENLHVIVAHTQVQGADAAPQIAEAIENLNTLKPPVDIIIVARGGGSLEDLWPFNEEVVVKAVYNSAIPVISGVGHEVDFSLCDFAADVRAPTPSGAAELVVQPKSDWERKIRDLQDALIQSSRLQLDTLRNQIEDLMSRPVFTQPSRPLEAHFQRVTDLYNRLDTKMGHQLELLQERMHKTLLKLQSQSPQAKLNTWKEKNIQLDTRLQGIIYHKIQGCKQGLENQAGKLNALSPLAILGRGYSITFQLPDKKIIKNYEDVQINDTLEILLHQGKLTAKVLTKENK